jgi:hypothetical protein|tara:strand:+ start:243 stop:524 length:282 start_codon:yes stop_codon:yes gene_type:complete
MSTPPFDYDDQRPVPFSREELEHLIGSCNACAYHQKQWRADLIERIEVKQAVGEGDIHQLIHHIDTEIANTVLAKTIAYRIAQYFSNDESSNN